MPDGPKVTLLGDGGKVIASYRLGRADGEVCGVSMTDGDGNYGSVDLGKNGRLSVAGINDVDVREPLIVGKSPNVDRLWDRMLRWLHDQHQHRIHRSDVR